MSNELHVLTDTVTGAARLLCSRCLPLHQGAAEHYEGRAQPMQPNRQAFKTAGRYQRAVKRAYSCPKCGRGIAAA